MSTIKLISICWPISWMILTSSINWSFTQMLSSYCSCVSSWSCGRLPTPIQCIYLSKWSHKRSCIQVTKRDWILASYFFLTKAIKKLVKSFNFFQSCGLMNMLRIRMSTISKIVLFLFFQPILQPSLLSISNNQLESYSDNSLCMRCSNWPKSWRAF